jgi:SWI/SNF-related matrix-associated actin-dependent regulator of chromatin subfamily A3
VSPGNRKTVHDKLSMISIVEVITRNPSCPMDRRAIGMGDLIEPPPPIEYTQASIRTEDDLDEATDLRTGSSAKIDQLLHLLRLTPGNEKSLVFSQFTTFLDKVCPLS